jgi:CO dehydrogenase maturation factor
VAVCGKGGTGKTISIALMARALSESAGAGRLLLIDADPAMGLLSALGVRVERTMGQVREEIIRTARRGKKQETAQIADMIDYMSLEALTETERFSVIAMGRTETLGCYCPVNTLLRGAIETLSKSFLLIISDPTSRGLETAAVIKKMVEVEKLTKCEQLGLVFNRVRGHEELLRNTAREIGLDVFGMIPLDDEIAEHDLVGKPIWELPADSPGVAAFRELVQTHLLAAQHSTRKD